MNLIIFDIDGTLIKNNTITNITFRETIKQMYGISDFDTNWDNYKYMTDIGILREIYKSQKGATLQWRDVLLFENNYYKNYIDLQKSISCDGFLLQGTLQMFEALEENSKWKCAIYTGGFKRIAQIKIGSLGMDYHDIPVAFAQDGLDRTNIYIAALEKAKVIYGQDAFDKIVLVGDSKSDIKVAKNCSVSMIGIIGTLTKEQFEKDGINSVLTDYSNVESFLEMLEIV